MTKVVLFDVYGTVAGWEPSRFEIQKAACSAFGFGDMITPDGILNGYGNADAFMTTENAHSPVRLRDMLARLNSLANTSGWWWKAVESMFHLIKHWKSSTRCVRYRINLPPLVMFAQRLKNYRNWD